MLRIDETEAVRHVKRFIERMRRGREITEAHDSVRIGFDGPRATAAAHEDPCMDIGPTHALYGATVPPLLGDEPRFYPASDQRCLPSDRTPSLLSHVPGIQRGARHRIAVEPDAPRTDARKGDGVGGTGERK